MPGGARVNWKTKWPRMPGSIPMPRWKSCSKPGPRRAMTPHWGCLASTPRCSWAMPGMTEETLLSFDYGVKKIGVAIGNTLTRQARPLEILVGATRQQRFLAIARLVRDWAPDRSREGVVEGTGGSERV